jgi:hypothetical protein
MRTIEAEIALMKYFDYTKRLVIPNVTEMSGLVHFETDILVLSKAGYATGVEIKVSASDLKKDLQKRHIKALDTKTGLARFFKPLKYFYYAVPEELVNKACKQIPDFCGILKISEDGVYYKVEEVRKPKHLFSTKWSAQKQFKLARLGALRIFGYKVRSL